MVDCSIVVCIFNQRIAPFLFKWDHSLRKADSGQLKVEHATNILVFSKILEADSLYKLKQRVSSIPVWL